MAEDSPVASGLRSETQVKSPEHRTILAGKSDGSLWSIEFTRSRGSKGYSLYRNHELLEYAIVPEAGSHTRVFSNLLQRHMSWYSEDLSDESLAFIAGLVKGRSGA